MADAHVSSKRAGKLVDIAGRRFGRVVVVSLAPSLGHGARWYCRCDCGRNLVMLGRALRSGGAASCGCTKRKYSEPSDRALVAAHRVEHHVWKSMLGRCFNPKQSMYPRYGGRGITVCERWLSFANFIADMGSRPSPELSIERKRVNDNYEPDNCVWATSTEQARNKTTTRWLTFRGETMALAAWADRVGLNSHTLQDRLARGWSVERALTPAKRKA